MAAVPSIGRANRVEGVTPLEAELTRSLYEQHANAIFRYCLHQLGSREEAEDAVQSTFLNAFRGIKRGVVPELESAWLFKIAHNVCLSRRRSSWRRGRVESPADFELVEEVAPAPSRRADELIGLQDVLEQMPEMQRRAILLREWQGLSYREIAEELELSQAAVETLIFRARRSLATGLEEAPATLRRRAARAADWGNLVTALKSLLVGGSAAAKIAATVAVVSATTVVAAEPVQQHRAHHRHGAPPPRTVARTRSTPAATSSDAAPVAPVTPFTRVVRHPGARIAHHKAAAIALVDAPPAIDVANPAAEPLTPVPSYPDPAPVAAAPAPAPAAPAPAAPAPAPSDKPKDDNHSSNGNGNGNGRFSSVPGAVQPAEPAQPDPATEPNDAGNKGNSWRTQQGGDTRPAPVSTTPPVSITPVATTTPVTTTPTATTPATTPAVTTTPSASQTSGPLTVSDEQPTLAPDSSSAF